MHALLVGATGATGKDLLNLLLKDDAFHRVDIFVRRQLDLQHDKLSVHLIDFDQYDQWKHLVAGDVLFSCLGTTLKAAGSKEAQRKIDYDYQYNFARAARNNNVNSYLLVSSNMANSSSRIFYTKIKGQLEDSVRALGFPDLAIFNPPILIRKNSDRPGELTGLKLIAFLNRIGLLLSQKPLPTDVLAQAMINVAKRKENTITAFSPQEIWKYAGSTAQGR